MPAVARAASPAATPATTSLLTLKRSLVSTATASTRWRAASGNTIPGLNEAGPPRTAIDKDRSSPAGHVAPVAQ